MGCTKGKDRCSMEHATSRCKKCGAVSYNEKDLCRPAKIKKKTKDPKK